MGKGWFDQRNLFEIVHPDYPGERLIACRNRELAKLRTRKRQALLEATAKQLDKVPAMVERGRLRGRGPIGVRVGRVVNQCKVAKHFALEIEDERFDFPPARAADCGRSLARWRLRDPHERLGP